ncbi:hypothetical protein CC86DRAFT_409925 [Ophiobolus disseminans]|uniref:Uncharacterized protein n=1 Tax=Ophiobolus disseminans TaxID=1469910 RepID=A0A6A6ZRC9_9PLEO|nr:hypothetical protein CC86DRAFT_409925 [Ophiobolus disseminans]
MPDLPTLAMFCKQNPKIKMRYHFENFGFYRTDQNPTLNFLSSSMALTTALHGNEAGLVAMRTLLGPQVWTRVLYREAKHWGEIWNIKFVLKGVNNFSIWPTTQLVVDGEPSNPQLLINDAEALGASQECSDDWLHCIHMWITNGISSLE